MHFPVPYKIRYELSENVAASSLFAPIITASYPIESQKQAAIFKKARFCLAPRQPS